MNPSWPRLKHKSLDLESSTLIIRPLLLHIWELSKSIENPRFKMFDEKQARETMFDNYIKSEFKFDTNPGLAHDKPLMAFAKCYL